MKKIFRKSLKIIGVIVILAGLIFGLLYLESIYYSMQPLKVEKSNFPEVNSAAEIDKLAVDLVAQMTLEEKIDQLYGEKIYKASKFAINFLIRDRFPHIYAGGNERLHIPPWVLSDGPRGARVLDKAIRGVTTFPVAMARGASWDIALEERINEVIAMEMRANKTNYAATPCINLLRHPGWGRAQETYGEDPWHLGSFGIASVRGIEKHDVMACPKHFALNSIENSRFVVDVTLDERTLREVYLPHFKRTIQEGKPASIMSAYNSVLGDFSANNKYLLTDILREEWGFEGFVTSDWVFGTVDGIASIKAGLDVEMPYQQVYSYKTIKKGIENGEITEADLDKMIIRTLKTRLKYAFAEDKMAYGQELIAQKTHVDLAREAAEKSMVLLKNNQVLPFGAGTGKKIAVLGRLANVENTGDRGSSNSASTNIVTPFEGIKNYHQKNGNEVTLYDGTDLNAAKNLAQNSDEVIVIVGYTYKNEGEYLSGKSDMEKSAEAGKLIGKKGVGGDRENLRLLDRDEELINAVAGLNNNMAVVYVGGSAINMSAWEDKVPAILFAWYGGMEGGTALANILYGKVNPSGKLPFSMAKNEADYPFFNPYTKKITYGYYHGYTLFDKKNVAVAYPFGYGLSYTAFTYENLVIAEKIIPVKGTLKASIELTNTGNRPGEEVVQLYIGFKNSKVDRPVKLLRGFEKILLAAGETKTVPFEVDAKDLAWYNPEIKEWIVDAMEYEIYLGSSSKESDLLQSTFLVE